jgi:hypothetical protein
LNTNEFLRAVMADTGYYCVVGIKGDSVVQKFYTTIEDVVHVADQLSNNKHDTYFGLATFIDGRSRRVNNAQLLKSFFLDLDCGVGKPYPSQVEGLQALKAFVKEAKLPRPLVVSSGRGIHAYWPLVEAVDPAQWLPVASALKELCVELKLHADPAVTSDVARVLRIPGTKHYKDDPPRDVEILSQQITLTTLEAIQDCVGAVPTPFKDFTPRELDEATKALLGNFTSRFKTILVKTQEGRGCAQLGFIATEQENTEEPLWRAGLSVANFCIDRDKAIHAISKRHPQYSPSDTEAKAASTKGPYTCATFEKLNPGGCDGCPHQKIIRSPIVLGREVQEATDEDNVIMAKPADIPEAPPQTYTIPKYPPPYLRGKNGGVFKRVKSDDTSVDVPIYHNDIYVVRRMMDPEMGESALLRLHLPRDGVREFTIPLTCIGSKDEFRKHVAAKGVSMVKVDELMYYISDWINHLQMTESADVAHRQFGWTDESLTSFVLGDREIKADRIDINPPAKPTVRLFPAFNPKGTLQQWINTANFFNRPGFELYQFALGVGFGSPLMAMTAVNAAYVHLWSPDSGLGKTTILKCATGIWGDPNALMTTEDDTLNTRMNRAEVYKNIVLGMDELTNAAGKELSQSIYRYSSGQQRKRMASSVNEERITGKVWQQLCISTGNRSLMEIVSAYKAMPKAEAQRVFELLVTPTDLPPKEETDKLALHINQYYGTAATPYIQYIINNREEVRELLRQTQIKLDRAIGLTAKDRFLSAIAACAITGLIIAKRLGLVSFKIADVVEWLIAAMRRTRQEIGSLDQGPEAILNNFLAENYNNILRIKSTDDSRTPITDTEVLIIPDSTPRISLVARYEYDIKKMYIMLKPFRKWCADQQLNFNHVVEGLRTGKTKAAMEKKRMGRGTRLNLPAASVLAVDCSEFMDDETEHALAAASARVARPVA